MNISVVICTYNRCASLKKTLASIGAMEVPAALTWELIVVDNNSIDGTKSVVESFASSCGLNVRYQFEGTPGLSRARNCGIRHSTGGIIVFTDDDVLVSHEWIAQIKKGFDDYKPACLGGRILRDPTLPLPDWWDRKWRQVLTHFDRGNEVVIAGPEDRTEFAWGANISFRRDVFEKYGLFRVDLGAGTNVLGEDSEIVLRLRQQGERVIYYPRAVVVHSPAVDRLSKQYLRTWNYRLGVAACILDRDFPKHWPRLLRVPHWRYKWAAQTLWNAARHGLTGGPREAFQQELNLITLFGYARTAVQPKRGTPQVAGKG